jgi:hypothetical protein
MTSRAQRGNATMKGLFLSSAARKLDDATREG